MKLLQCKNKLNWKYCITHPHFFSLAHFANSSNIICKDKHWIYVIYKQERYCARASLGHVELDLGKKSCKIGNFSCIKKGLHLFPYFLLHLENLFSLKKLHHWAYNTSEEASAVSLWWHVIYTVTSQTFSKISSWFNYIINWT